MYNYEMKTYDSMPVNGFARMDDLIRTTYSGDLTLRYDASRFVNVNLLADNVEDLHTRLQTIEGRTETEEITNLQMDIVDLHTTINELRQENHDLQDRLNRLEMLLGEN